MSIMEVVWQYYQTVLRIIPGFPGSCHFIKTYFEYLYDLYNYSINFRKSEK